MRQLTVDNPAGGFFPYTPPSVAEAKSAQIICDSILAELDEANSYGEDFLVEMQNALLGDLFGTHVKHRVPLDPKLKAISLDRFEELER